MDAASFLAEIKRDIGVIRQALLSREPKKFLELLDRQTKVSCIGRKCRELKKREIMNGKKKNKPQYLIDAEIKRIDEMEYLLTTIVGNLVDPVGVRVAKANDLLTKLNQQFAVEVISSIGTKRPGISLRIVKEESRKRAKEDPYFISISKLLYLFYQKRYKLFAKMEIALSPLDKKQLKAVLCRMYMEEEDFRERFGDAEEIPDLLIMIRSAGIKGMISDMQKIGGSNRLEAKLQMRRDAAQKGLKAAKLSETGSEIKKALKSQEFVPDFERLLPYLSPSTGTRRIFFERFWDATLWLSEHNPECLLS